VNELRRNDDAAEETGDEAVGGRAPPTPFGQLRCQNPERVPVRQHDKRLRAATADG
jgi:hypothetical protein